MDFKCPCEGLFVNGEWLAVAIAGDDQKHVGILFRQDDHGPLFFHLAWHYRLVLEPPNPKYCWAISGLDEFNQKAVASAFASVAQENGEGIPYSSVFDIEGPYFDIESWKFIKCDLGEGLTCATFLMAVFKQLSIDLFDYKTWQSRTDDEKWQQIVLDCLRRSDKNIRHADALEHRLKSQKFRFRPEEVAAAVADPDIPLSFVDAERNGQLLVEKMRGLGCLSI